MKYRIISPRVGTPGDLWEPPVQINVGILLKHGFIEAVDNAKTANAPKLKRTKVSKDKE